MINLIFIIIGFIFLIKGANFLVDGSSSIARKLKISEFVIGLTIVSIGTSLPELIVSIESVLIGHNDLLIGNIIGSCIYNLLLILGIICVIKPIKINIKEKSIVMLMFFSILLVELLSNIYGQITRVEGIILILFFIIFLLMIFNKKTTENKKEDNSIVKSIIQFLVGILLLKYGGDFVVKNASLIARKMLISEKIIGITIVAIGTSLPELVTSITAINKNTQEIAVGNIIGSNIFNLLLVFGITSIINPIQFSEQYNQDFIFLAIITLVLIISALSNKEEIQRKEGIILLISFILYNIKLIII